MPACSSEPTALERPVSVTTYPQAPGLTESELHEHLATAELARIATHNEDGTIHVTPLWYRYDRPDILLGTQAVSRKVRNIARDPEVTVLVDVSARPYIGAVLYGTATVEPEDAEQRRVEIFRRYMDDDAARGFAASLAARYQPVIIRVHPHTVVSYDYRKGFPV
jgi:PPOX class probable F420-dependent enzyme